MALRIYEGAVAIVTGGASGIGRALGEELARRGAVVVLADLQEKEAEAVAEGIRGAGRSARAVLLEVADAHAFEALVADVVAREGRLDYLFNNAGIAFGGLFEHMTAEDGARLVAVNLGGVLNGVRAAWPRMLAQGYGHIVNTASVAGLMPSPLASTYAMTKHAVVGLSRALRAEGARRGVRVSALCPGPIRTPIMTGGVYGGIRSRVTAQQMLEVWERLRPLEPEELARKALDRVARNDGLIVLPWWVAALMRVLSLSPLLGDWFGRYQLERVGKEYPEMMEPPEVRGRKK